MDRATRCGQRGPRCQLAAALASPEEPDEEPFDDEALDEEVDVSEEDVDEELLDEEELLADEDAFARLSVR